MPELPKKGHLKKGMLKKVKFHPDKDTKRPRCSVCGKPIPPDQKPVTMWVDGAAKRTIKIEPERRKYYIMFSKGPIDQRLEMHEKCVPEIIEA